MTIEVVEAPEFQKDLKKMKIRSIWDDVETFKKAVAADPECLRGIKEVPGIGFPNVKVFKHKKFRCRELGKGTRNIIRLVYAHFKDEQKVLLIEMYKKNQQTNHSKDKIIKCINDYVSELKQRKNDAEAFM